MRKYYLTFLTAALIASACGSARKNSQTPVDATASLDGYEAHALSIVKNDKIATKVEIIPGKTMEVDCNRHSLSGTFKNKPLSDGNDYYVFESDGNVASTLMACPDKTKHTEFVQGQSIFIDEGSPVPPVVYASRGFEIRHRLWQSSPTHEMGQTFHHTIETEATKALSAYPQTLSGYKRYVLFLPEIKNSQKERKVEIVPGVTENVDCNSHRLMGRFSEKNIDGWGYTYLIFESDGGIRSTRMACPDGTITSKFVTGETQLLNYNDRLPVVVFVPEKENFSVQYKIWEAGKIVK